MNPYATSSVLRSQTLLQDHRYNLRPEPKGVTEWWKAAPSPDEEDYAYIQGIGPRGQRIYDTAINASVLKHVESQVAKIRYEDFEEGSCLWCALKNLPTVWSRARGQNAACRRCSNTRRTCVRIQDGVFVVLALVGELRAAGTEGNARRMGYWIWDEVTGKNGVGRWTRKGIWRVVGRQV